MTLDFDIYKLETPYYIVDEARLTANLKLLQSVSAQTGCRILLAQKAFSMFYFYPLIGRYLNGTAASGLYEAKLGRENMGGETHIFSPAYRDAEFDEILELCDHVVFNSLSQWERFREKTLRAGRQAGLRVNPECSTQDHKLYDPCAPGSRFGVRSSQLEGLDAAGIDGLHFHTLCEQNADALETTLAAVEARFGHLLERVKWVNFGGGHHITRSDYDISLLISCIRRVQEKYGVLVYLEPGEAVALDAGYLVASVVDVVENELPIAILDASAACHMPDVLEMPYRPNILGAKKPGEKPHTFRLGGPTCLAGDMIGEYSFDTPLAPGDRLVFCDMAHYTMVKNNMFNGIGLPSIAAVRPNREVEPVRAFGYSDFKNRLS